MRASAVAELEGALAEVAGADVELERPSEAAHGDYATNVALRLAPARKRAPRELAEELAEAAAALPAVERAEVAGPGFVNLFLGDRWYRDALAGAVAEGERFGAGWVERAERIQVEMVSANPTGPIHVAAARNGAYGDSVARLLERAGHSVEREYYINDTGRQIELFRESVEAVRRGEEPPEDGYRGEYIAELAKLEGDPVAHMLEQVERTLERFRIRFGSWARQTDVERELSAILERIDTYEKDGAIWARSSTYGDDDDRVLIRSPEKGGLPTYRAADVAYLANKLERGYDRAIYVLGADHHGAAKWYAAVAQMLGYDSSRVEVLLYQLVHLVRGGELTQVSKRRGDIVTLDEFMDEVGVDAARWYLVSRGPDQTIEIDVDLARERSEKNPVYYVQYAHARIAGILRNLAGVEEREDAELQDQERDLVKRLLEFPEKIAATAAARRAPHMISYYAIQVADDFHRFYHHCRVIEDDRVRPFRRDLCLLTRTVIAASLDLIGVEAPVRM